MDKFQGMVTDLNSTQAPEGSWRIAVNMIEGEIIGTMTNELGFEQVLDNYVDPEGNSLTPIGNIVIKNESGLPVYVKNIYLQHNGDHY